MSALGYAIGRTLRRHPQGLGRRSSLSRHYTIPAPTMGWNTRDPLGKMKPGYAVVLDNFFPHLGRVGLRSGYTRRAQGLGATVETLFAFLSGDVRKLFAFTGGGVYDVTPAAALVDAPAALAPTVSNGRWRGAMFSGRGFLVNGADAPLRIEADGTFAAAHGWTGTGLTATSLNDVTVWKNRLFFSEIDSARIWYGPLNSIMGELSPFDLSRVDPGGGTVVGMGAITLEAGVGVDDLICFFLSTGRVLVYGGTDISDADAFGIVGRFKLGRLVSRDGLENIGSDLIAVTPDGYVPMIPFLQVGDRSRKTLAISDAIGPAVRQSVERFADLDGWQALLYPAKNSFVVNIPQGGSSVQHVQNIQTGAWCRYIGWNATCMTIHDDKLYFGDANGNVHQADSGENDDGTSIEGDAQTAYAYIGGSSEKRVTMARVHLDSDGDVSVDLTMQADFEESEQAGRSPIMLEAAGSLWDVGDWDVIEWSGGRTVSRVWKAVNLEGTAISARLRMSSQAGDVQWYSTDVLYDLTTGV